MLPVIIRRAGAALAALPVAALVLSPAGPARAAVVRADPPLWQSCVPGATLYLRAYRVDNDLFAGQPGRLCTSSRTGRDYRVLTCAPRPDTTQVVAYPQVRVGQYWASGDVAAQLPAPSRRLGLLHVHITAGGRPPAGCDGYWQQDIDLMFSATAAGAVTGAHNYEAVIIFRTPSGSARCSRCTVQHIQHRTWYGYRPWVTQRGRPGQHLIMELMAARPSIRDYSATIGAFVAHLRRLGWLPGYEHLDYFADGAELWPGSGLGLTSSMTIRWTGRG